MSTIDVRLLGSNDLSALDRVAEGVFDNPIDPRWARVFFADARHHLVVAIDDGVVVGMASAVDYVHPDKAPQLFINEVAVASTHRQRGIAARMLGELLSLGRALECTEAWVGTQADNMPARRLYERGGGLAEPFVLYLFSVKAND